MNTNSVSNRNLSYWLFLAMTACVLMAASVNGQSYVNLLANPQWDPTTTNGTDGGRNWSFSYQNAANRAYQLNDFWGVAHPGSGVGKYGMVKYECGGATAGDFQYARSPWYTANHGSTWTASAWFRTTGGLKGTQQGLLKIVIADSSFNVIASQFVTVVTTNSADVYTLGNVSILAPTNAAYVYMEAGLYNPNAGVGAGVLLVDDASLSCPNQFLPNPGWDPTAAAGNGGRWWTYTYTSPSEGAQQNNDYWGVAREGVASGVMGFLKASVDGTVANDFQRASSGWLVANPGDTWVASVFGQNQSGTSLHGSQTGILVLQYADSSTNILLSLTNTVVSTNSDSNWKLGAVSALAPAGTAWIQMQVGTYSPNTTDGSGFALFDDASLTTTNQVLVNPGWDPTRISGTDGGRDWTFSSANANTYAQFVPDLYYVGRLPCTDGVRGVCKLQVDGTFATIQTAASSWYPAAPGSTWKSSVYAWTGSLVGNQTAFLRVEFADASSNVLATASNAVLTSASPTGSYKFGSVSTVAPSSTTWVRIVGGLSSPDTGTGTKSILFDDIRLSQVIGTTTTLDAVASPQNYGTAITFNATVSPSAASGTVTFNDGTNILGVGTLSGGFASYTTATNQLAAGLYSITAVYGGDGNYNSSTSSASALAINSLPVAYAITMGALSGEPASLKIIGGKYSPTDDDGDPLSVTSVSSPAHGSTVTDGTNVVYTAAADFAGTDTFDYTVDDNRGGTASATVTVNVIANGAGYNLVSGPVDNGNMTISMVYAGIPGNMYALETTSSLVPPINWTAVTTNATDEHGILSFTINSSEGQGFFRTRFVP